jgi:hypothetical protein
LHHLQLLLLLLLRNQGLLLWLQGVEGVGVVEGVPPQPLSPLLLLLLLLLGPHCQLAVLDHSLQHSQPC